MHRAHLLAVHVLLVLVPAASASQISRITLSELHATADLIVLGEVIKLVQDGNRDHVTIEPELYLKGRGSERAYTFILISRGGLKDFDPTLKKGDTGVFFLKLGEADGQAEKAYWGSVATFRKNHFDLTKEKTGTDRPAPADLPAALDAWLSYRVKRGQVQNTGEYEGGFRRGFAGPPGLVDRSADYNLGHSDGMLAITGKSPSEQDAGSR